MTAKVVAKKGIYGGWLVKENVEELKKQWAVGQEIEAYEYELAKIEVYDETFGEFREVNYVTASGRGMAYYKAKIYFRRRKVRMKVKKISDNYIVLDIVAFGDWEDYKVFEGIAFGGRYASYESLKYAILEEGLVKEWKEEYETGALSLGKGWWTAYYVEDKEAVLLLKNTVEKGGRVILIEIENSNNGKEELKEVLEEISKLIKKYGEEKVRKAFEMLFVK